MFYRLMNKLMLVVLLGVTAPVWAQESQNPYELVSEVATITFDRIKKERAEIEKNPELLRTIMEQELLPYVDYKFAALKVLGKHFKSVPKQKIPEFIQVFREYLISTYALALAQYDDQTVVFDPPKDVKGKKSATVRALIKEEGRPDIKLAFKVRLNKKTKQWKAYDMVAEGISLLSSKQSELESVIRQQGIDKVIEMLAEKNKQPINLKKIGEA